MASYIDTGISYKVTRAFGYIELTVMPITRDRVARTSTWACKLYIHRNGGTTGSLTGTASYNVTIDGKVFNGSNISLAGYGTKSINLGNVTFQHDAEGRKLLSVAYSVDVGNNYGTIEYSKSLYVDMLVLASLSINNGTLGVAQTLTVTPSSNYVTHIISYRCMGALVETFEETSDTSIIWTPPKSLAEYAPANTEIEAVFTIESFSNRNEDGSVRSDGVKYKLGELTYTITLTIPSSFKPTCTLSLSEETAHYSKYGAYVSGRSKIAASISPTLSYKSEIDLYQITGFGTTIKEQEGTLTASGSGELTITATVKDKRGRSGTDSKNVTVIPYEIPSITTLKVKRCNSNGVENINGAYCQVTFGGAISSLNGKNTATYKLGYKKTDNSSFTEISLSSSVVAAGTYIFAAEDGSSYDVKLTVTDDLDTNSATTILSTAGVLIHFGASGNALGLGKIAEIEGGLDIGYKTRFFGGTIPVELAEGTNFDTVITPNNYVGNDASSFVNAPTNASGGFTLEVEGVGTGDDIRQILKTSSLNCERLRSGGTWGSWRKVVANGNVLWSGEVSTEGGGKSVQFSETVSEQPNGICVVFAKKSLSSGSENGYLYHFIPKYHVEHFNNGVIGFPAQMYGESYGSISAETAGKIYFRLNNNGLTELGSYQTTFVLVAVIGV